MKVLAVTGGAHGIGHGVAKHFSQAGYAVSIADAEDDAARHVVETLEGHGAQAMHVRTDIADADQVERWITETVNRFGCPDVLVNNAGISHNMPFLELPVEEFNRVIAVNLRGTFLCSQTVARQMAKRGIHGAIVNIASTRAFMSEPGTEAYTASKGGIFALTHGMAISLAEHRIRVNCICPGWIETRMAPVQSKRDHEQHPVGRVGQPHDIAEACMFLAEHAGFMTGQSIIVDGGMSVKMIYEE